MVAGFRFLLPTLLGSLYKSSAMVWIGIVLQSKFRRQSWSSSISRTRKMAVKLFIAALTVFLLSLVSKRQSLSLFIVYCLTCRT